jgi:hypothetical protein
MARKSFRNGGSMQTSIQNTQAVTPSPKPAVSSPAHIATIPISAAIASCKLSHDQIAQRAKTIWQARGCPLGQDQQNWLEAEKQLRAEMAAH